MKFQVLKYNQAFMARLGIYSYRLTEPTNEFFRSIIAYYIMFSMAVILIVSSAMFIYKNPSQVGPVIAATSIVISGFQMGGMFLSVGLNMKKVKLLHLKLQEIVDNGDCDTVHNIYWKNEQKCRKYTKRFSFYIVLHQTVFVTALISSIYAISVGNRDTSTWKLPFYMAIPFDTSVISNWYILWFVQLNAAFPYCLVAVSITSYFVCCCFYIGAACDHLNFIIDSFRFDIDQKPNAKIRNAKKIKALKEQLIVAVKHHTEILDVFNTMAEINSGTIFSLLPLNSVFMAISIYNIEHSDFNLVNVGFNIFCLICSLIWPVLFCFFATHTTARIASIAAIAYGSNWYDYPLELRPFIILFIQRSQEQVYFSGLNMFRCTLETFGKIFKSSCSYYILFRSLQR